jgi:outer membrane protein assembly complex, YaeT protein
MHKVVKVLVYLSVLIIPPVLAVEKFVIEDIRVEGLQRITPGTVFNYLPMKVGDTFDDTRSAEAVRALFKTGFFEDVRLERDGGVLVFIIKERPAIGSITLNGNKDIRSEDLIDGLRQIGIAEGRIFNQSQLDKLEQELRRQYFSLGKYAVNIKSTITPLEDNRVAVTIDISEGITARIRQINIVGNEAFAEKKLLKTFKLTTPTMLSFFTKRDQYSREKLAADLESLRSYYLDHGYINFNVDSTQVSITPDKKDIYITINITEGDPYTISGVKLAGEFILPEEELFKSIQINKGELFSRGKLTKSTEGITNQLGDQGYSFANVNAIPEIDKETSRWM